MYLTISEVCPSEKIVKVETERLGDDFLSLSVINGSEIELSGKEDVPSYWRLIGEGNKPPFEIGINTKSKAIVGIFLFVLRKSFRKIELPDIKKILGEPRIDTSIFKKIFDVVDTSGEYSIDINHRTMTCVFENYKGVINVIMNGRLGILIDDRNSICGFIINELAEDEESLLKSVRNIT